MKKLLVLFSLVFFLFVNEITAEDKSRGESQDDPEHWPTIKELSADQFNFGILHNWGVAWASVTRIQKQENVSNFVWNDRLIGAFYEMKSHDFKKYNDFWAFNFMGRMAIYYPYKYTFRDVTQNMVQTILYNLDWFTAPMLTYNFFGRVRFDLGIGLHMSYQKHDKWNYFNLGAGAKLDAELPISSRWTVLLGGMFSWDNGNLGSNRHIRPFDYVYEYQVQIGARYSKKYLNPYSYIKYKPKPLKTKKVRKIETLSEDINLDLDIAPEDVPELKEENKVVEEETSPEPEEQQVVEEETSSEQEEQQEAVEEETSPEQEEQQAVDVNAIRR